MILIHGSCPGMFLKYIQDYLHEYLPEVDLTVRFSIEDQWAEGGGLFVLRRPYSENLT